MMYIEEYKLSGWNLYLYILICCSLSSAVLCKSEKNFTGEGVFPFTPIKNYGYLKSIKDNLFIQRSKNIKYEKFK